MRSISNIFGRTDKDDSGADQHRFESFTASDVDGRFCVLRLTAITDETFDTDTVALWVDTTDGRRRLLPVDSLTGGDADRDARTVEFLLPAPLLDAGRFALQLDDGEVALDAPVRSEGRAGPADLAERVLMSQQEELAALTIRLASLRQDLRRERQRTSDAEEELHEAQARFNEGLLLHRSEVRVAVERARALEEHAAEGADDSKLDEAERALAESREELARLDDRRAALASELAEAQSALHEERAAAARLEERVRELESAAAEPVVQEKDPDDALRAALDAERASLAAERAARERAEDELGRLQQALEAARADAEPVTAAAPRATGGEEGPAVSVATETLADMSIDGLAEIYDTALGISQRNADEADPEGVERWTNIAHASVLEALQRGILEDGAAVPDEGWVSRRRHRVRERRREQLIEACRRERDGG